MRFKTALLRFFFAGYFLFATLQPAWAFRTESRIPLVGCRGFYAASGSAKYVRVRQERKLDEEELVVEVKNVPLAVGTTLVVFVGDEVIGTIKLDSRLSGSLKVATAFGKFVPSIEPGTSVFVKTVDGRYVMW